MTAEHGRSGKMDPHRKRVPMCLCGRHGARNPEYDAYYCAASRVWLEDVCDDPECCFCPGRPETAP